ncbi:hypothetical protein [Clostridium sp.]
MQQKRISKIYCKNCNYSNLFDRNIYLYDL